MLVLLDRDGVINRDAKIGILREQDFDILPRVTEAIAMLTKAGFSIAICTNQSAIGRGQLSEATLNAIHDTLQREVNKHGGKIDAFFHAPDIPEKPTARRKPGPGMLLEAIAQFGADPAQTPMVGDMLRDMEAALAAGCPRILVRSGKGAHTLEQGIPAALQPVTIVDDLFAAAEHILSHYTGTRAAI